MWTMWLYIHIYIYGKSGHKRTIFKVIVHILNQATVERRRQTGATREHVRTWPCCCCCCCLWHQDISQKGLDRRPWQRTSAGCSMRPDTRDQRASWTKFCRRFCVSSVPENTIIYNQPNTRTDHVLRCLRRAILSQLGHGFAGGLGWAEVGYYMVTTLLTHEQCDCSLPSLLDACTSLKIWTTWNFQSPSSAQPESHNCFVLAIQVITILNKPTTDVTMDGLRFILLTPRPGDMLFIFRNEVNTVVEKLSLRKKIQLYYRTLNL